MNYYKKADLQKIRIESFSEELRNNNQINYSDALVEDIDSDFILDDADIFRQGVCQLFAFALNQKYGYTAYILEVGNGFHIFCKSSDKSEYIDVRGKTKSFEEFVYGSELAYTDIDISKEYVFSDEDFNGEHYDIGLAFAQAIIENDAKRYQCD